MPVNPLSRETEARREGALWRVYAPPMVFLVLMCGTTAYLAYASYASTHLTRRSPIIIIPSDWSLTDNKSIKVGGTVPGGVYSDLLKANVLNAGSLYYRYNDLKYRWVSKENWTYATILNADAMMLNHSRVALVFDGLDTAAEVVVNGYTAGRTNNMFVRYFVDVKDYLKVSSENTVEVKFESPVEYAKRQFDIQAAKYIVPPKCVDPAYKGECHANHIRKMQASFSWDWGPAFPNSGIWKDWCVVAWNTLLITDVFFSAVPTTPLPSVPNTNLKPGWTVTVKIWCEAAFRSGNLPGSVTIALSDIYTKKHFVTAIVSNYEALLNFTIPFAENQIQVWWPNGYGPQPLYKLNVVWNNDEETEPSSKSVTVGFRTVELNQDFIDPNDTSKGRHYRVRVNNVDMFMKGSNWIPAHILPEMVTPEYTRYLLQTAADTHQNCIRVWGGGIYETDEFYEIADELGILIWQDFMFACSMYPSDEDFLETVTDEVVTQVRRLQHHPSILLWASNNENEAALRQDWYGTASDFEQFKADYVELYVDTIRTVMQEMDDMDTRPFVVSSPSNGLESENNGYIAANPYSTLYGDVHYYNYISDAWLGSALPRTRFASEYGFQSWPSFKSMKEVTIEEDWHRESSMMYHRQHHPLGQVELAIQIGLHMHMPPMDGTLKSYQDYLYLTQVHQAVAVKVETEFYRRWKSRVTEDGEGYTSGALYWQLNDIWQGASWASIEYGGRWKMLHYYAKKFFSPVIVTLHVEKEDLKVFIVSDKFDNILGATLRLELHRYDTRAKVKSIEKVLNVSAAESELVASPNMWEDLQMDTLCKEGLYDEQDVCFMTTHLLHSDGSQAAPDNFHLFGKPKDAYLPQAIVKIGLVSGPIATAWSNWTFNVTLTSDSVALFVWLETDPSGVFIDNGFVMTEAEISIFFYASEETTLHAFQSSLTVKCLTDTYQFQFPFKPATTKRTDQALHPNDIRNLFYA